MENKTNKNKLVQLFSRIFCRIEYFCSFATISSIFVSFIIIYNIVLTMVLTTILGVTVLSNGAFLGLQGLGKPLFLIYLIVGIIFAIIMDIVFTKDNLKIYHQFRSFAGLSFAKQMDEKRRKIGCLNSIIDFFIFSLLLWIPMSINIYYIVLITQ